MAALRAVVFLAALRAVVFLAALRAVVFLAALRAVVFLAALRAVFRAAGMKLKPPQEFASMPMRLHLRFITTCRSACDKTRAGKCFVGDHS